MRILLLDNHDSFTWNLQHLLVSHGEVDVVRNDVVDPARVPAYDRIVLSPGPGLPLEAGRMPEVLAAAMGTRPVLGVCLGLQAIVVATGGSLYNLQHVRHGVAGHCRVVTDDLLFRGLPVDFPVGLYHSWAAQEADLPKALEVTARGSDGVVLALRHRELPVHAVQFHPESVLTPDGPAMIANWLVG